MSDYLEPPVDADTAIHDNAILADIAEAEARVVHAADWTAERDQVMATIRMDRLARYRRVSDVRMWVIAGLVGAVLWFAGEAWGL